jgi:hypothetical protein
MWGDVNCKLDFDNILDENYNLDEVQALYRVKLSSNLYICTKYDAFHKGTIYRYELGLIGPSHMFGPCGDIQLILTLHCLVFHVFIDGGGEIVMCKPLLDVVSQ